MPEHVTIFEMGPRDGLQNEARQIPTEDKIRLVDMLTDCGFQKIEVAACSATESRSVASAITIIGFFPPHSNSTRFRLLSAA